MADLPLLLFPRATQADRTLRKGFPVNPPHIPTHRQQAARIGPRIDQFQRVLKARRLEFSATSEGVEPEQVLVLETIGAIDNFATAARGIQGLEWLGEAIDEEFAADDYFYDEKNKEQPVKGRLFLSMANQKAMDILVSLWNKYQKNQKADLGFGRNAWKEIFKLLKDLRRWSPIDRLYDTYLLTDWEDRLKQGDESLPLEVELWFRKDAKKRAEAESSLRTIIEEGQGQIIDSCIIPEIHYHAILANVPSQLAGDITKEFYEKKDKSEEYSAKIVKSEQVMFLRPTGQSVSFLKTEDIDVTKSEHDKIADGDPVIALLDGYPLANHVLLKNRIIIGDVDDFNSEYEPNEYRHGTAMASLIIYGNLDSKEDPLDRPIYVRPIMKPKTDPILPPGEPRNEFIPDNVLVTDLIHRAVKEIFEGTEAYPARPSVRIINLSIADPHHPLIRFPSSWARLLDWLSYKYNVLFCISTGNYTDEIVLDKQDNDDDCISLLKYFSKDIRNCKILAPAESINSLTVGASHDDEYDGDFIETLVDICPVRTLPSPISKRGLGFNRSIKPEILLPGGRQLYSKPVIDGKPYKIAASPKPPGIRVAFPGLKSDITNSLYTRGTSNSTALASRYAAKCLDILEDLLKDVSSDDFSDRCIPPLLKAMIVHGARWDDNAYSILENALKDDLNKYRFKAEIARHIGYGIPDITRVLSCTEQRATLVGFGELEAEQAHEFKLPLPPSLSDKRDERTLTITLAWTSPINPGHKKLRRAELMFDPPLKQLKIQRLESDWQAVRRGTIQHERMGGSKLATFQDGDDLVIKVSCKEVDGKRLVDLVPYGLIVSLETKAAISIYEEIRAKVQIQPQVRVAG